MIENIIKDMVESNTTGRLTDASKRFVARMKEKNEIKKLLVDNSRFFAGYEANADKIAADIANVLSEENLSQLAADLSRDSGYTFKARLEKWLTDLMSEYEIPHEEERLYANRILDAVFMSCHRSHQTNTTDIIRASGAKNSSRKHRRLSAN